MNEWLRWGEGMMQLLCPCHTLGRPVSQFHGPWGSFGGAGMADAVFVFQGCISLLELFLQEHLTILIIVAIAMAAVEVSLHF